MSFFLKKNYPASPITRTMTPAHSSLVVTVTDTVCINESPTSMMDWL